MNVLIINDCYVATRGFEALIEESLKDVIIFNANKNEVALAKSREVFFDIVILNNYLNGFENLDVIFKLKNINDKCKVILFSLKQEESFGAKYFNKGADAFFSKEHGIYDFMRIVSEVLNKGFHYNIGNIKNDIKRKYLKSSAYTLSKREFQIAFLLVKGFRNVHIARQLDIKMSTISTYKKRVFEKLMVDNIIQLSDFFKDI